MKSSTTEKLKPRKQPVQERSGVTVDAIYTATIQVLLADDMNKLTTTRVAERAGVSVGTLYQYFPNKEALLYAILLKHFEEMARAYEEIAAHHPPAPLSELAACIADTYVSVKMVNPDATEAMYRVAGAINQVRMSSNVFARIGMAICNILAQASDATFKDPKQVTFTVLSSLAGLSRASFGQLAAGSDALARLQDESRLVAQAYLHAAADKDA
ncbi:TetR family transcriptional regulator [Thalassospira lucentensis]|uniref:TetR/AcrR family transcriptional regulator n=1 Tax=Thalassospira lucentensis TaxID=168935 RepID=UPI003D2EDFA2